MKLTPEQVREFNMHPMKIAQNFGAAVATLEERRRIRRAQAVALRELRKARDALFSRRFSLDHFRIKDAIRAIDAATRAPKKGKQT